MNKNFQKVPEQNGETLSQKSANPFEDDEDEEKENGGGLTPDTPKAPGGPGSIGAPGAPGVVAKNEDTNKPPPEPLATKRAEKIENLAVEKKVENKVKIDYFFFVYRRLSQKFSAFKWSVIRIQNSSCIFRVIIVNDSVFFFWGGGRGLRGAEVGGGSRGAQMEYIFTWAECKSCITV